MDPWEEVSEVRERSPSTQKTSMESPLGGVDRVPKTSLMNAKKHRQMTHPSITQLSSSLVTVGSIGHFSYTMFYLNILASLAAPSLLLDQTSPHFFC
jgi:hypothetical protein